jgi:hypothetical protein
MGFVLNGTGKPVYNTNPQTRADLQAGADFAELGGKFRVGTTTDRNSFVGASEGWQWYDTTLKEMFFHDGSGWSNGQRKALLHSYSGSTTNIPGTGYSTFMSTTFSTGSPRYVDIEVAFLGQADASSLGFFKVMLNGVELGSPRRVGNLGQVNAPQTVSRRVGGRTLAGANTLVVQGNHDAGTAGWYANSPQLEVWAA